MAFKGTTRRSAREIVEEIEAVGGDLNAGTSTETTAYYARVMKEDVPLALDVLSDILSNLFVPDELEREKSVIVQEIGAAQDTPDDRGVRASQRIVLPGSADGTLAARHAKDAEAASIATCCAAICRRIIAGPDMVVAAAGAVITSGWSRTSLARFAAFDGAPAPKPQVARCSARAARAWCIATSSRRT